MIYSVRRINARIKDMSGESLSDCKNIFMRCMEISHTDSEEQLAEEMGLSLYMMNKTIGTGIFDSSWAIMFYRKYNVNIDYILKGELPKYISKTDTNNNKEVLQKAILRFGEKLQLRQVQEEAAELIVAINHFIRFKDDFHRHELLVEVADIEIMLEQLRLILNDDENIERIKQEKLIYLNALITQ